MSRRAVTLSLVALVAAALAVWLGSKPDPERPGGAAVSAPPAVSTAERARSTLSVLVTTAGRPVAGAAVAVLRDGAALLTPLATGETGADGRCELAGIAMGTRELVVQHPELARHRRSVELVAERVELTISLERGVRIEGSVLDGRGRPVAGAIVRALGETSDREYGQAPSDASGAFRIAGLDVGSYRLYVRSGRHRPRYEAPVRLSRHGDSARVTIRLEDGSTLSGRVVDAQRQPLAGASVGSSDDGSALVSTDELGRFELAGLADGPVNVFATSAGFAPTHLRAVRPGKNLEIVLEHAASLDARIALAVPASKLMVSVCKHDSHFDQEICVARKLYEPPETNVSLEGLPVGEHELVVEAEGHATARIPVSLSPGRNFTVPLVALAKTTLSP